MSETLVIQSYRTENVPAWINSCLGSVEAWASLCGLDYRFFGNEIFQRVPAWYRERAKGCLPVLTDLGRLILVREALGSGVGTVIWVDADILIFDPEKLRVDIDAEYAFSRELWVQPGARGLKVYRNVHNAFCMFRQGNPFLDFYIHACLSVMRRVDSNVPNQIVGTKLLTAMHNIIGFPLVEQVGMASPLVLQDLSAGAGGPALTRLVAKSPVTLRAVNLCGSLVGQKVDGVSINDDLMARTVVHLNKEGPSRFRKP